MEFKALKLDNIKKSRFKDMNGILLLVPLLVGLFLLGSLLLLNSSGTTTTSVVNFVLNKGPQLETENNRVNVLLLGIPGGRHEGATLSDTIMVASYDLTSKEATLVSLPRDLWVDSYKVKVNALYQTGKKNGEGLGLVKKEIGDILGVTIPYAVRLDFSGFVTAVDLVEGVEVEVANSFDDYFYPVPGKEDELCDYKEVEKEITEEEAKSLEAKAGKLKVLVDKEDKVVKAAPESGKDIIYTDHEVFRFFPCRFEHLNFQKGVEFMDGGTALKFVRSRHGTNNEGSDFARSKRQQLVLQAFKNRILSLGTLTDPQKITGLVKTFGDSVETDIETKDYLEFIKLVRENNGFKSFVVDGSGKDPLLVTPNPATYGGAWVLVPSGGSFSRIHRYVSDVFSGNLDSSASATIVPARLLKEE